MPAEGGLSQLRRDVEQAPGTTTPRGRTTRGRISGDVVGLGAVVLAYVLFCIYAARNGMPAAHLGLATVTLVVLQLFPGVLIWRAIRPRNGWLLEDLAFGFACGFALSVVAQSLGGLAGSRLISIALPLLVAAALLGVPITRQRVLGARRGPTPAWLGVVMALSTIGAVPGLVNYVRQNPVAWGSGFRAPQVDQYFQLAMAQQLLHRGPGEWPLVSGESMSYHWFAHAWMAHVSAGSGVSPEEILLRFAPVLSPFLIVVSVAALALRISGRPLVAAAAVAFTMFGGSGSVWRATGLGAPLHPESPTLALSVPPLLALVAILAMRWQGQPLRWSAAALVTFAVTASGTKGSATPLVIAGAALSLVAMLAWRRDRARVIAVDLVLLIGALLLTMKVVFQGSANALLIDPAAALRFSWPVSVSGSTGTLVLVLAAATMLFTGLSRAAFGFAVIGHDGDEAGRRDPVLWLLLGGAIAGAFAPLLFVQPGASQFYFRISAIPLAATASAVGLVALRDRMGSRTLAVLGLVGVTAGVAAWIVPTWIITVSRGRPMDMAKVLMVAALLLGAAALVTLSLWGVRRAAAVLLGAWLMTGAMAPLSMANDPFAPVKAHPGPRAPGAIGAQQVAAAEFIGDHSAVDDVVMTNRHCTATPDRPVCDARYFMVSAQSGRQMLLEGWGYSPTIAARHPEGRESITAPFWDPALQRLNDAFYTSPSGTSVAALWNRGVRWVYVDKLYPSAASLAPHAVLRLDNEQAQVWQLVDPDG